MTKPEDDTPQSVREWIERLNEAEERLDASDDDLRRLPAGWWILPSLMLAVFLVCAVVSCT